MTLFLKSLNPQSAGEVNLNFEDYTSPLTTNLANKKAHTHPYFLIRIMIKQFLSCYPIKKNAYFKTSFNFC